MRSSEYAQETADAICEQLSEGVSLRKICAADDMPACSTVFKWLIQNPPFAEQYARAREEQAETLAAEVLDIADDVMSAPDCRRIRIDARKWAAGKLKPKVYGEKQQTDVHVSGSLTQIIESLPLIGRPNKPLAG